MKQPKPPKQKPGRKPRDAPAVSSERVPLFPDLSLSEVEGIKVAAILGEDDVSEFDGVLPKQTTLADLRKLLAEAIAAPEYEGEPKAPGRLELELTARGVKMVGKKREPYDVASREIILTSSGDGEPVFVGPTGQIENYLGASSVGDGEPDIQGERPVEMRPEPRTGPRTKRGPREHTVAPEGSQILPADVTGDKAIAAMSARELRAFYAGQTAENQKALADGTRMLVSSVSDGVRKMFAHAENRDERIVELKGQIAELKQDRLTDRAEYARKTNDLEEELFSTKRKHRREVDKLDEEIADLKEELEEAQAKAAKGEQDMKGVLWGLLREYGPGMVTGFLEKQGIKVTMPAANGAPA